MLALEISAYGLTFITACLFCLGVWRLATRDAERIHFAPLPLPEKKAIAALEAAVAGDGAAFRAAVAPTNSAGPAPTSPASSPASTTSPVSSPASTWWRGLSPRPALQCELDALRARLGGDVPEAIVVLATIARYQECGLIAVPRLTRALVGMGRSAETALQLLLFLNERRVLELRPDASVWTIKAAHYCPRGHGGVLLGYARLAIGDIEEPVNNVSRAAGEEPELHHVAAGKSRTSCLLPIGELAAGLVGQSGELGWTTHGPSATCKPCRRALGLPDRVPAELEDDGAATILVGDGPPRSAPTLVSAGVGAR